ncbi:MAG TPA: DUF1571 domain-containing protein [Phycisphaerae bacterium]|nr:DUF1571 domain-containing protein [Phycisphaerae bacterium]
MALKRLLRPTNRRVRYLVGCLLVGLFCIQCIPSNNTDDGSVLIARTQTDSPEDVAARLVRLAKTDHVALLEQCRTHVRENYRDYTCTFIKQERLKGALGEEQEIRVKFLASPFSVVMNWVRNAPIGDQVLYVGGKYNGNMIVRPKGGFLQMLTGGYVLRKPDGPDAMKNTLRPVSMFGFERGLDELVKVYAQARDSGDLKQGFGGFAEVAGRKTLVLERHLPAKPDYPAWKTLIYIDAEHMVPTCIEGWDWDERLTSRYVYKDIRFNVGLTEDDFLPEANGIKMKK